MHIRLAGSIVVSLMLAMPAQASLRPAEIAKPQPGVQTAGYFDYAKCVLGRYREMAQKFDGQVWGIYFTPTQLVVSASCFEAF